MSAAARIGGFGALLAVIFAAASLAGAELDPSVDESDADHAEATATMDGHAAAATDAESGQAEIDGPGETALPGLAVAQSGYGLVPAETSVASASSVEYAFRIVGTDGETVQDFGLEHERRMHLIVVRRDFESFQHVHPEQLADGSWTVKLDTRLGGVYRVFADFATADQSLTLGADLFVSGEFVPEPLPAVAKSDEAGDGYTVSLDSATPQSGTNPVRFTVSRDGRRLDSVDPYLGADGHLVALREHDQAYLHTHPQGEPGGPGPITFEVEYPTAGRYRLFLQFKHAGEVRTAAFTQEVTGPDATGEEAGDGSH